MKGFILALGLILSIKSFGSVSFKHGNQFKVDSYSGIVRANCPTTFNDFNCYDQSLSPANFTRLVSEEFIDADRYWIEATFENGKKKTKDGKFKRRKRRSSTINLWVRSVFQRPLLRYGINEIRYKLYKKKELVLEGSFDVSVETGEYYQCGFGFLYYNNNNACFNQYQVCSDYLNSYYCR